MYSFSDSFNSGFDIAKSYTGGYGDVSSFLSKGSGSSMDPTALAIGLGGSLISGLFGIGQAQTSASIAQANLAAQNQAILEGREQTKAALGSSMWGPVFAAGTGGDIAFGREKEAKKWLGGPFADLLQARASEEKRRARDFASDPRTRELSARERKGRMEEEMFKAGAPMAAMYGPTRGFASLAGKYGISV
jgi:hypothetical protein